MTIAGGSWTYAPLGKPIRPSTASDRARHGAGLRLGGNSAGRAGDAAGARDQSAVLLPLTEQVLGSAHPSTLIARASLAYWTGESHP